MAAPIFVRACAGSSPLARGTPLNLCLGRLPIRFIPAYAGNSSRSKASIFVGAVHPRLRGELKAKLYPELCQDGSSPLTRGTREILQNTLADARFIPAYAGNSELGGIKNVNSIGSSPLTRGTHTILCSAQPSFRFIPAYAGNSVSSS